MVRLLFSEQSANIDGYAAPDGLFEISFGLDKIEKSRVESSLALRSLWKPSVRRRCGKCHSNWTLEKRE
jgi:hypothetical protein